MDYIFAPWRIRYILAPKYKGCIFCDFPAQNDDEKNLILYRSQKCFIIMNKYPYNPGHLMVAPYRHVAEIEKLTEEEEKDLFHCLKVAIAAIKSTLKPHGFNVGVNIGRVAGAGIEDHVHMHVVPRWNGDTNFMPVLADVKVIPEALEETYKKLKKAIETLKY